MKKARSSIPPDISSSILFQSDRTCCVCREPRKSIQIHHLDENPSNNAMDNLVVLCLDCHDQTQITGGFGRKLSADQVILYRNDWHKLVEKRRNELASLKKDSINTSKDYSGETEIHSIINCIRENASMNPKDSYDALYRYFNKQGLNPDVFGEPCRWDQPLHAEMLGQYGVVCTVNQYNLPGFVVFIDSFANSIALEDVEFPMGIEVTKSLVTEDSSPEALFVVRYISITGTGTFATSVKLYAIDNGFPILSLDKPYYEHNSGWGAFENDPVIFKLRNDYLTRNGLYEIHTQGIITIGDGVKKICRKLPEEIYVWDSRSKQFEQVDGRMTHKQGLLTSIYSDFADPKGDWFKAPPTLTKKSSHLGFVEENW